MGKKKKIQPTLLPEKLLAIRLHLNFTQEQMVKYVVPETKDSASARAALSEYETGRRAPSLLEVLHYARTVRNLTIHKSFTSDDLIDHSRELPFSASGDVVPEVSELNEDLPSDSLTQAIGEENGAESAERLEDVETDYPHSFYFSGEFLMNFDNYMMRLLLAVPYHLRERYCDSSVTVEIAVTAALRDLERMDRAGAPSLVVECLHEHIASH